MMIDDKRESTKSFPVIDILEEVIPLFQEQHFLGIRRIVLLDDDYRKGDKVAGRYCRLKGTNQADIEMFFSHLSALPKEVQDSRMYLTYRIVATLMHEIYHHIVRGQKRLKKPTDKIEESRATKWSYGAVSHVFKKLFPQEQYEEKWKAIQSALDN